MYKFSKGQKVRVISIETLDRVAVRKYNNGHIEWHNPDSEAILFDFMAIEAGKKDAISDCSENLFGLHYSLEKLDWVWADWMLEKA